MISFSFYWKIFLINNQVLHFENVFKYRNSITLIRQIYHIYDLIRLCLDVFLNYFLHIVNIIEKSKSIIY